MEVRARAKINLFLRVLDRRSDGYHNIETVFQSVDLSDRLAFRVSEGPVVLKCSDPTLPGGRDNLVVRAAEMMQRRFPDRVGGLEIRLEKGIPAGSGLGGGSADAAAVIRACNGLFGLGLTTERLAQLGTDVGMDVPFLIDGGRAIGRGRGEQLAPLPPGERAWAVIVVPETAISTRWAYEALERLPAVDSPPVESFVERLLSCALPDWACECFNAFERVVFPSHPELETIRDRLLQLGCAGAFLTGSGSAVVGLVDDGDAAARIAAELRGAFGFAQAARFLSSAETEGRGTAAR